MSVEITENGEVHIYGRERLSDRPRIGILTSGGDCPGLNAVIRAATKSAFWLGYDVVGFRDGFEGMIDPIRYQVLEPAKYRRDLGSRRNDPGFHQ